jgi:hypothetical protein
LTITIDNIDERKNVVFIKQKLIIADNNVTFERHIEDAAKEGYHMIGESLRIVPITLGMYFAVVVEKNDRRV